MKIYSLLSNSDVTSLLQMHSQFCSKVQWESIVSNAPQTQTASVHRKMYRGDKLIQFCQLAPKHFHCAVESRSRSVRSDGPHSILFQQCTALESPHWVFTDTVLSDDPQNIPTVQWKADAARSYYGSSTNYQGGICKVHQCIATIATLPLPDTIILVISPPILPSLTLAPGGGANTSQPLLSSSVLGRGLQF